MKRIAIETGYKKILSDVHTPVGIYLRLRDRFRDTILLESTDYHVAENSFSFICINAIAGIEITSDRQVETKFPGDVPRKQKLAKDTTVADLVWSFMQQFEISPVADKPVRAGQGLFGYTSFDAVQYFDTVKFQKREGVTGIPLMRYRLYQYVIVINHFKDELIIHLEACIHLHRNVEQIKTLGMKAGVAINPHTPVSLLKDILEDIDLVCLMSVNPGFGGQSFIPHTLHKIRELSGMINEKKLDIDIEIDGGVDLKNAQSIVDAGANVLVAGSTVFNAKDPADIISKLSDFRRTA
jgi:ribulose-phosphate 3-epimerase